MRLRCAWFVCPSTQNGSDVGQGINLISLGCETFVDLVTEFFNSLEERLRFDGPIVH